MVKGVDVEKTGKRIYEILIGEFGSIKDIAGFLGLTVASVYHWRNGKKIPSIENLIIISDRTGVPLNDMIVRLE